MQGRDCLALAIDAALARSGIAPAARASIARLGFPRGLPREMGLRRGHGAGHGEMKVRFIVSA